MRAIDNGIKLQGVDFQSRQFGETKPCGEELEVSRESEVVLFRFQLAKRKQHEWKRERNITHKNGRHAAVPLERTGLEREEGPKLFSEQDSICLAISGFQSSS